MNKLMRLLHDGRVVAVQQRMCRQGQGQGQGQGQEQEQGQGQSQLQRGGLFYRPSAAR